MSLRYWMATLGNWLGVPLGLYCLAVLLVGPARFHVLAGTGLYILGMGTHRFMVVMEQEYQRSQP